MTNPLLQNDAVESNGTPGDPIGRRAEEPPIAPAPQAPNSSGAAAPSRIISGVEASLWGWAAVALWNAADIARLGWRPNGLLPRLTHHLIDFGHVLAVALVTAGGAALWSRFGPRRRVGSVLAVALVSAGLGPVVLSKDLSGFRERVLGDVSGDWLLPVLCAAVAQAVTVCFLAGRLCAHPRFRWLGVASGVALIVVNEFVLRNGYRGAHVLLCTAGATCLGASLTGASTRRVAARLLRLDRAPRRPAPAARAAKPATTGRWKMALGWLAPVILAGLSLGLVPSSAVQIEFLERDTALLFPWLRPLYAPARVGEVPIPPELRHWFQSRATRADLPPPRTPLLPKDPIVILITVDALRSDVLDARHEHAAPNLHALRRSSVYFSQARTSSTDTLFSLATLFTGRHFSMLNWNLGRKKKRKRRGALQDDRPARLGELLRESGVQTALGVTVTMMEKKVGLSRGLEEELRERPGVEYRTHSEEIAGQIIERLKRHEKGSLFVYTHFLDPHDPYETHGRPAKTKFDAYLIEVSVADEQIGRIRRAVNELGLRDRTAFIVSADHGEGFGEHRVFTHGKALYDVLVHVPMMIELPGVPPRTVDDFVMMMDLGPTVLDLFGVPTPGTWMGESLTPFLNGGRADPSRLLLMERHSHKAMLFPDGLKVVKRRTAYQLFDVLRDPGEERNLWDEQLDEGRRRLALLETYVKVHTSAVDAEGAEEAAEEDE